MSDIDLTDAARAVRPYVGCCVDCPCGIRVNAKDIESMLHAALPHIREQLAQQIEEARPEIGTHILITERREALRDGMNRAARIVRGER